MIKYTHTYRIDNPTQRISISELSEEERNQPSVHDNNLKASLEEYVLEHFNYKDDILYYVGSTLREVTIKEQYEITRELHDTTVSFICHINKDGNVSCYEIGDTKFDTKHFHSFKITITNEKKSKRI